MSLFTDGPILRPEDLRPFESSILDVAASEGISLSAKIEIAQRELGRAIMIFLMRSTVMANDQVTPEWLKHVVVTDGLKDWHAVKTLSRFYRDASHNQLNDRYQEKWRAFEEETARAADAYLTLGVGWVDSPLERPAMPTVVDVGGFAAPRPLFLATSWVGRSGEESAVSEPVLFNPSTVDVRPRVTPVGGFPGALGWNVYAGTVPDLLLRQNPAVLSLGTPWDMPAPVLTEGNLASMGQRPSSYVRRQRTL